MTDKNGKVTAIHRRAAVLDIFCGCKGAKYTKDLVLFEARRAQCWGRGFRLAKVEDLLLSNATRFEAGASLHRSRPMIPNWRRRHANANGSFSLTWATTWPRRKCWLGAWCSDADALMLSCA